jgi:hypothetical protein
MKKFLPFLFLSLGVFAVFGVLFLLIRTDAVPARIRTLHWRTGTTPEAAPAEETIA